MRRQILMCFLLMVSLLLQAEAVFACASMDGMVQSSCCCPDMKAPTCDSRDDGGSGLESASGPCCEVFLRLMPRWVAADAGIDVDPFLSTGSLQIPAALLAVALIAYSPFDRSFPAHPIIPFDGLTGTDTYLITRRFRD